MEKTLQSSNAASNWEFIAMLQGWQQQAERLLKDQHDTTTMQFWVLSVPEKHGRVSIRFTSSILDQKYTTVAEAVASLERKGAIEKHVIEDDRRVTLVSISEEGARLFRLWDATLVSLVCRAWDDFDDNERKQSLHPFYLMGKRLEKVRVFDGMVRGDTAFLIACAQISGDFQRISEEIPLSPAQAVLLALLREQGPSQPKTIARLLAKPPSAVSRLFREIVKRNLVLLSAGPSKREVTVSLTDKGNDLSEQIEKQMNDLLENRFGNDPTTMHSLRHTAFRLMERLRQETRL